MSELQPELDFARARDIAPQADPRRALAQKAAERLPELVAALRGRGWVTARELAREGFTDRLLRAIVEADGEGQIFSYPGSPGYILFGEVTVQEFKRADALKSQGQVMIRRWARYQRRYRRRGLA